MGNGEKRDLLKGEVEKQLRIFAARRRRDKRKSTILQMASVTLSATITVLLGLRVGPSPGPTLTNVALSLGALATVLAAYDSFFDHRKLWVARTITLRRLEDLKRDLAFRLSAVREEDASAVVDELFAELNKILEEDRREWLRIRNEQVVVTSASRRDKPSVVDRSQGDVS